MEAIMGPPTMSRARATCTTCGRSCPTPFFVETASAVAKSSGRFFKVSGFAHTDDRAPKIPSDWMSVTVLTLVAQSTNFHDRSAFCVLALIARPQDGMLYGCDPFGPAGSGATPTVSTTDEALGSTKLALNTSESVYIANLPCWKSGTSCSVLMLSTPTGP